MVCGGGKSHRVISDSEATARCHEGWWGQGKDQGVSPRTSNGHGALHFLRRSRLCCSRPFPTGLRIHLEATGSRLTGQKREFQEASRRSQWKSNNATDHCAASSIA